MTRKKAILESVKPMRPIRASALKAFKLSPQHIEVFLFPILEWRKDIAVLHAFLSHDECQRAERFKLEQKRQQYIITRGCLRQCLSNLTGIAPKDCVFEYLKYGKPVWSKQQRYSDLSFNISHTHSLALIAISRQHSLGIDIEKIQNIKDPQPLVSRYFSPSEQIAFNQIAVADKARAFCTIWTRKEAFIKAIGEGIAYGLDNFDVSADADMQVTEIKLHKPQSIIWTAYDLPVNEGYTACLVSNADNIAVRFWLMKPLSD